MLKNILNIGGVQELSRAEQKSINGGGYNPACDGHCGPYMPCGGAPWTKDCYRNESECNGPDDDWICGICHICHYE